VGLSRGAVYHHFADKADLFRAVFHQVEQELNETVIAAALTGADTPDVFRRGVRAFLGVLVQPEYLQIAATDAPVVLGLAEWHEVDAGIGMASMRAGLEALHDEGLITAEPDAGLVICLFGALTELGLATTRDEITLDEAARAFERLVARLR
jgi:AcrR family transcriptional regulator